VRVALVAIVLAATAGAAQADGLVEAALGLDLPLGDKTWTNIANTSPMLAVRAGSSAGELAGMLSADWTPISTSLDGFSYQRYRLMFNGELHHRIAPRVLVAGRFGLGVDIVHASYSLTVSPNLTAGTNGTDVGIALEAAIGVWYDLGNRMFAGLELALPISKHNENADQSQINFDYTSVDLAILGTVRFGS
jgi:hypothetical protein